MEDLLHNKWLLYGGVAVAAIAGYWFLSNYEANAAANASAAADTAASDYYTGTPVDTSAYTSGTGTPVDTTGGSDGSSTSDIASVLAAFAAQGQTNDQVNTAAEIAMQTQLGQASIDSNNTIAQLDANVTEQANLTGLASTVDENLTSSRLSQQNFTVTDGTNVISANGVNIFQKASQNAGLVSGTSTLNNGKAVVPVGTINLPTGGQLITALPPKG